MRRLAIVLALFAALPVCGQPPPFGSTKADRAVRIKRLSQMVITYGAKDRQTVLRTLAAVGYVYSDPQPPGDFMLIWPGPKKTWNVKDVDRIESIPSVTVRWSVDEFLRTRSSPAPLNR